MTRPTGAAPAAPCEGTAPLRPRPRKRINDLVPHRRVSIASYPAVTPREGTAPPRPRPRESTFGLVLHRIPSAHACG
jgi:hypothetical protein